MPYRDKDKLKEYQKNYFKKNQWSLNTKQNKRRSMTQSQSPKDSIPDSIPENAIPAVKTVSLPESNNPVVNEFRQKIADIQMRKEVKSTVALVDAFKDDIVIERVYE